MISFIPAASTSVTTSEVRNSVKLPSLHVERLRAAALEARLRGEVAFPGEPADVTVAERTALWREATRISGESSQWPETQGTTPAAAIKITAIAAALLAMPLFLVGSGIYFLGNAWEFTIYDYHKILLIWYPVIIGSAVLAGAIGIGGTCWASRIVWKNRRGRIFNVCRELLGHVSWSEQLVRAVKDLKHIGTEIPVSLQRLNGFLDNKPVRVALSASDAVALMRLTDGLERAASMRVSRLVIEGETAEMLSRACEALGGGIEEMRL